MHLTYLEAAVLGLVQGLTEFLPVSSSGHLALLQNLFGFSGDDVLFFTVLLHLGTLVSVFIVYWHDFVMLVKELFLLIRDIFTRRPLQIQERPYRKLGLMIIVATIPTALIGLLFNDFFESLYSRVFMIGIGWLITGVLLFTAERVGKNSRDLEHANMRNALFVGILQGIAIYPGISRSGSTMVGGLFTNMKRDLAVRFAFLISIPAIMGSAVLEIPKAVQAGIPAGTVGPILVGVIIAAVSGYAAIKAMISAVVNQKLKYFSYYVWVLGIGVIIYSFIGA